MTYQYRGFNLIELMVTLAILALLAMLAAPLSGQVIQRQKEQELRIALQQIRTAIDAYKQAVDEGYIPRSIDQSGYPPTLETLVEGVENARDPSHHKIYFLRKIPRDPMNPNTAISAASTWGKRAYDSPADNPREGADVFDVYSLSKKMARNGIPYGEW